MARANAAPHGTTTRYKRHGCHCEECRAAVRDKQRERRARARAELVPAAPFVRVLQEWLHRESTQADDEFSFAPMRVLADRMEMDISNLSKIKNGRREWIGFDLADKIVCICTDGLGWLNDHELRTIYEGYDLTWLDTKKPTVEAA